MRYLWSADESVYLPKDVLVYEPPTDVVAPAALYAAAAGLLLLVLLTSVAVARGQVAALRGYLGMLIVIGLPTRWARHVLLFEHAVIIAVSVVLAALIAIPPVLLSAWRIHGFVLAIPWSWLTLVALAFVARRSLRSLLPAGDVGAPNDLLHQIGPSTVGNVRNNNNIAQRGISSLASGRGRRTLVGQPRPERGALGRAAPNVSVITAHPHGWNRLFTRLHAWLSSTATHTPNAGYGSGLGGVETGVRGRP